MAKYTAKTLSGAQARVRQLEKQYLHLDELARGYIKQCDQLAVDRRMLAKLSADGPCFDNPLIVYAAKQLRDKILREECKLAPDGKFLPKDG